MYTRGLHPLTTTTRSLRARAVLTGVLAFACRPQSADTQVVTPDSLETTTAAETAAATPRTATAARTPFADPIVERLVLLARTDGQVQQHLAYLTKTVGPRLTSSHNLMRAEQWCRDQFDSWGLEAQLEAWGTFPVGFDRGPRSGGMIKPETIDYDFTTPAWTPGVHHNQRGIARMFPASLKEAKRDKLFYKDAWIVMPASEQQDRRSKREADEIEAILREAAISGFIRRARGRDDKLVHTSGDYEISWNHVPQDVQISLRGDQYEDLVHRLAEGNAVELAFSIDNAFFRGPVRLNNVVADIQGTEFPQEFVLVGGHLDSWDGAQGAVDNGTGVATTMEAARLLMASGARPKRTIRFVLWSGEEQGLLGSRGYVQTHAEELDQISAVFVHDGGTNFLGGIAVTPEMLADAKQVFEPVTRLDPTMPFYIELTEGLRVGGSDHTPFIHTGVPAFFWIQHGRSDYDHAHHTQFDTFEAAIPEYQQHSALVVAIAAWNVANLDHLLPRENSSPLARRRLGVELSGSVVQRVEPGGAAERAGWREGDEIVGLASAPDAEVRSIHRALQQGEPRKTIIIRRKGKELETTLDWSNAREEAERKARMEARAAAFGDIVYGEPVFGKRWSAAASTR